MIIIAELTMCSSTSCPYSNDCYRAKGISNEHQSWSDFEYTCNENSGFENFVKMPALCGE